MTDTYSADKPSTWMDENNFDGLEHASTTKAIAQALFNARQLAKAGTIAPCRGLGVWETMQLEQLTAVLGEVISLETTFERTWAGEMVSEWKCRCGKSCLPEAVAAPRPGPTCGYVSLV